MGGYFWPWEQPSKDTEAASAVSAREITLEFGRQPLTAFPADYARELRISEATKLRTDKRRSRRLIDDGKIPI